MRQQLLHFFPDIVATSMLCRRPGNGLGIVKANKAKRICSGPCMGYIARLVSGGDRGNARSFRPSKLTANGSYGLSDSTAKAGGRIGQKVRACNMFQTAYIFEPVGESGAMLLSGRG
jgi:hypothetical protein